MIARHWKGIARPEEAANYIHHLMTDTFPTLSAIKGFIKASILRRIVDSGMEFLIITDWASMDAIKQFAGESPDLAVVPPAVREMMVSYDTTVAHFEVALEY